jgi:phosphoglycolate phosphatase
VTLERLRRAGLRLGVLSNKPDGHTQYLVARLFGSGTFDQVLGKMDSLPLKPDPASALLLAERLGCPAARTALVGDSSVDMQTARNAGMLAVGAAWGFRGQAELQEHGADVVLDVPEVLPGILLV